MVFNCNKNTDSNGVFLLGRNITALANSCLNKEIFIELWHGFSYRCSSLQIQNTNEMFFMIGNSFGGKITLFYKRHRDGSLHIRE